jgi:hypothetical protein
MLTSEYACATYKLLTTRPLIRAAWQLLLPSSNLILDGGLIQNHTTAANPTTDVHITCIVGEDLTYKRDGIAAVQISLHFLPLIHRCNFILPLRTII